MCWETAAQRTNVFVAATSAETNLGVELATFPVPPSFTKSRFLSIKDSDDGSSSSTMLAAASVTDLAMKFHVPSSDVYSEVSILALKRLLEGLQDMKAFGAEAEKLHLQLCVRTVLGLTLIDLHGKRPFYCVVSSLFTEPILTYH